MQFQPALVRLGDGEGERIVKRLRRAALAPVRYSDHGSRGEAYSASHAGRTWKITALKFNCRRAVEQRDQFGLLLRDGEAGLGRPVSCNRRDQAPRIRTRPAEWSPRAAPAAKSIAGVSQRPRTRF